MTIVQAECQAHRAEMNQATPTWCCCDGLRQSPTCLPPTAAVAGHQQSSQKLLAGVAGVGQFDRCTRTRTHTHTHTHTHTYTQEMEQEEMRSPSRAHPLTSPMVPASPHQLGRIVGRVNPSGLPGSTSWLWLSSSSPDSRNTPAVCCGYHSGTCGGAWREPAPLPAGHQPLAR